MHFHGTLLLCGLYHFACVYIFLFPSPTAASLSVEMGVLIGVLVVIAVLLPVGLCLVVLLVCRLKRKPVHKE